MTTHHDPLSQREPPARSAGAQRGVTLVELMISMVIVSIAVAATFALGFSLVNGYREHRRMMEVERSARVSMEIVADAIRLASAGVPTANLEDLVGCSAFRALRITNNTNAPDEIEVIHASGGVLTFLRADYVTDSNQIDVFDGTELHPEDYIIITNGDIGHLRQIRHVTMGAGEQAVLDLVPPPGCTGTFPGGMLAKGSFVIRAQSTRFYIENSTYTGNVPTLMLDPDGIDSNVRAPEPIAQGIEDMQVAVGVDDNPADGALFEDESTTDEWYYNVPGDPEPASFTITQPRAIRLTLIGRSITESSSVASFIRPGAEDRAAASTPDVFRRRVLSSVLEIRNLEGSPP